MSSSDNEIPREPEVSGSSDRMPRPRRAMTPQELAAFQAAAWQKPEAERIAAPAPRAWQQVAVDRFRATYIEAVNAIRSRPAAWIATLLILSLYAISAFVAWSFAFPPSELESSWYMVLHWAFLNKADFGREIIFTYGPLGFLLQGYHPQTYLYCLLTWLAIAGVWLVSLVFLSRRLNAPRWVRALWIVLLVALVGTPFQMLGDARLLVTCWSLVLLHFFVDRRRFTALKLALVVVLSIIGLGKFSLSLIACGAVILVSLDLVARRAWPWPLLVWIGCMSILWPAAGQPLSSVLPWLRNSLEIATGYAQAEGSFGPHEARDVIFYLGCASLLCAAVIVTAAWSISFRSLLVAGGLAGLLFLVFKMGYVRHDGHEIIATTALAALAMMYAAAIWPLAQGRLKRGLLVSAQICGLALAGLSYHSWESAGLPSFMLRSVTEAPRATWDVIWGVVDRRRVQSRYDAQVEEFKRNREIPHLKGSVDGFSFIQRSIFAHNLDYHPRPIFQGYLAYTPRLAQLNAAHFRGDDAPDWVVFDLQQIDNIYSTLNDAAVWPELLSRYRYRSSLTGALLLQRMGSSSASYTPLSKVSAKLGEWVEVPASTDPIWARIRMDTTVTGRLLDTVYKQPHLLIDVVTPTSAGANTLLPRMMGDGFLLSPLLLNRASVAMLFSDRWSEHLQGQRVVRLRLRASDRAMAKYAYPSDYTIEFSSLNYPRQDLSKDPAFARTVRFRVLENGMKQIDNTPRPQVITGAGGQSLLFVPPPRRFAVDVPRGSRRVRIDFGMLLDPFQGATLEGVDFCLYEAYEVNQDLAIRPIWKRRLDPTRNPHDQGPQAQEIDLPDPAPPRLVLETTQGSSLTSGAAYWLDLNFR